MGSEMCIRDSYYSIAVSPSGAVVDLDRGAPRGQWFGWDAKAEVCLLYTSDAADERSSVDLGGRRIIKKKNTTAQQGALTSIIIELSD